MPSMSVFIRVLVFSATSTALVTNLSLRLQVMLLITFAFIGWTVTFATWVVTTNTLRVSLGVVCCALMSILMLHKLLSYSP